MDLRLSDKNIKPKRGFVTLLFVLIVFAAGSAISISLLSSGTASSLNSFALDESARAKAYADACAERGLERVRDERSYTGTIDFGSCRYTVINSGGSNRTVQAQGSAGNATRRVEITVDRLIPKINISSWQEVADF